MKLRTLFLLTGAALIAALPIMAQDATEEATGEAAGEYTVNVSSNDALGDFFVGPNGMTLYTFDPDTVNTSNCSGKCLENWPALTVESADAVTADEEIYGTFGTITRADDNTLQVTYNGLPLYYWAHDKVPGDTTGQAVGKVWWVASPATVSVLNTEAAGHFLVGPNGMTVYLFSKDAPGVSNCADKCAEAWPPVTVDADEAEDLLKGANVGGTLGTIERADGTVQVTYNEWPLYYFAKDAAIGDTTGDKVGGVWFVIHPETVVTSSTDAIPAFLTAANGFTLYTFANDTAGVSNCADDCAKAWPPFTVASADNLSAGVGVTGKLGSITRADGKIQVTYNDMPLYYFAKDAAAGDTTGDKVGGVWNVALP